MSTAERFGLKVRTLRKQQGLTQEQLAQRMDRSVDSISQLERGINLPSFETLDRLSTALRTPIKEFFEEADEDPKRAELITTATSILRGLDDRDLKIAVEQLKAMGDG